MNKKKIFLIITAVLFSLILIITFIKINILNKNHFSINIDDDIVDYSLDEKKNIVVKTEDKKIEYQVIQSDYDTTVQVKNYIEKRNYFVDAYDKYIEEYKNKIENLPQDNEDYIYYSQLITKFEIQKEVVRKKYNEQLVDAVDESNVSLSDNWKELDSDNTIETSDSNIDKLIVLKTGKKYDIQYSINTSESISVPMCNISEAYLRYTTLTDEEKSKVGEIPEICDSSSSSRNIAMNQVVGASAYPSSYSLLDNKLVTPVGNQKSLGYCTIFSSNAMLEGYMLRKYGKTYDLSEKYFAYKLSIDFLNGKKNKMGFYPTAKEAYGSWNTLHLYGFYGPILEKTMPFDEKTNLIDISKINRPSVINTNEMRSDTDFDRTCSSNIIEKIKKQVYATSPVKASIKITDNYNTSTAAVYDSKKETSDHAITIVGWDDNYSKDNFKNPKPSNNGAFLIKNSWGTSSGINGYYWVSYEDKQICTDLLYVMDADTSFNDNGYINDYGGDYNTWGSESMYVSSRFVSNNPNEVLKKVKFWVAGPSKVEAYLIADGSKEIKLSNSTKVGEKTVTEGGVYTITLSDPKTVNSTFNVILKYTKTTDSDANIVVRWVDNASDIPANVMYQSFDGKTFSKIEASYPLIEAYTDTVSPIYRIKYYGNGGKYNDNGTWVTSWLDSRKFKYKSVYPKAIDGKPLIYSNKDFFVRNGYTFTGWNTKANGKGKSDWTGDYYAYNPQTWRWKNGEYGIGDETANYLNLYAQWEPITYRILYHGNGGKYAGADTWLDKRSFIFDQKYKNYTSEPIIWDNTDFFKRDGYIFKGWNTVAKPTSSNPGYSGWAVNYMGDGDHTWKWYDGQTGSNGKNYGIGLYKAHQLDLFAQWGPIKYTFRFNANQGTGSMSDLARTFDVKVNLPKNTFTRQGYVFVGWNSKADGSGNINYADGALAGNDTLVNGKVINLYAQWKKADVTETFSIKYNLNGGTVSQVNPSTYTNKSATFTLNNPKKSCYKFLGWRESGMQDGYLPTVTISTGTYGNKEYTAIYEEAKYNIYFYMGETEPYKEQFSLSHPVRLEDPVKNGLVFKGWSLNGTSEPVKNIVVSENNFGCRSVILYPKYDLDIAMEGSSIELEEYEYEYTGSEIRPTVYVLWPTESPGASYELELDKDYTVSYSNNINVGVAKIHVTGINRFAGELETEFTIKDPESNFIDNKKMFLSNEKVFVRLTNAYSIKKSDFVENINTENVIVYDKNNNEVTDEDVVISTGFKVKINNIEYPIVFMGDVDGSGYVNINDLTIVYRYIMNSVQLDGLKKDAADYNMDGNVNISDLTNIYRLITEKKD